MLLTPSLRMKLQALLARLSRGSEVSLEERLTLRRWADRDSSIASALRRALRGRGSRATMTGVDGLMADLDLGDPEAFPYDGCCEDLARWFSGSPPWLRRS